MSVADPNDAPKADHLQSYKCDACKHLHVVLIDEEDRYIATAVISREMSENMFRMLDGPPQEFMQ